MRSGGTGSRCIHHTHPFEVLREGKMGVYILIHFISLCTFKRVITIRVGFKYCCNNGTRLGVVQFVICSFGFGSVCGSDMLAYFEDGPFSCGCA